jgi:hypothetical protein
MDEWLAKREQIAKSSNKANIVQTKTEDNGIVASEVDAQTTDKLQIRESNGSDNDGVSIKLR